MGSMIGSQQIHSYRQQAPPAMFGDTVGQMMRTNEEMKPYSQLNS